MKTLLSVTAALIFTSMLGAADIYVDYEKGNNANNGTKDSPYQKFAVAIRRAKPGDTVYILPASKPIRDTLVVRNKKGAPGKPIIVDGMNNIFLGTEPLSPKKWKEVKPGYFSFKNTIASSMANRYFMVRNGKAVRMGRFNKAKGSKGYKSADQLQPGEWTLIRGKKLAAKNPKRPQYEYEYLLRLPEGAKTLAESGFEEPLHRRISGVNIAEECHYIHFRNIIVKNFLNDGYNIHGNCRNIIFENVAAVDCGDDAISAHETSLIYVKNFVAIGCSTAICHINKSENHHENVYAEKILGRDIFLTESTKNSLVNGWFKADSIGGFRLTTRKNTKQTFVMKNVRMLNSNPKAPFEIQSPGILDFKAEDVKIANYAKMHKFLAAQIKMVPETEIEAEIAAARKRLFAIFGGQLEKALGE